MTLCCCVGCCTHRYYDETFTDKWSRTVDRHKKGKCPDASHIGTGPNFFETGVLVSACVSKGSSLYVAGQAAQITGDPTPSIGTFQKWNAQGKRIWRTDLAFPDFGITPPFSAIAVTDDGAYLYAVMFQTTASPAYNLFKIDAATGEIVWKVADPALQLRDVCAANDGGCYIAGSGTSTGTGSGEQGAVAQYSSSGSLVRRFFAIPDACSDGGDAYAIYNTGESLYVGGPQYIQANQTEMCDDCERCCYFGLVWEYTLGGEIVRGWDPYSHDSSNFKPVSEVCPNLTVEDIKVQADVIYVLTNYSNVAFGINYLIALDKPTFNVNYIKRLEIERPSEDTQYTSFSNNRISRFDTDASNIYVAQRKQLVKLDLAGNIIKTNENAGYYKSRRLDGLYWAVSARGDGTVFAGGTSAGCKRVINDTDDPAGDYLDCDEDPTHIIGAGTGTYENCIACSQDHCKRVSPYGEINVECGAEDSEGVPCKFNININGCGCFRNFPTNVSMTYGWDVFIQDYIWAGGFQWTAGAPCSSTSLYGVTFKVWYDCSTHTWKGSIWFAIGGDSYWVKDLTITASSCTLLDGRPGADFTVSIDYDEDTGIGPWSDYFTGLCVGGGSVCGGVDGSSCVTVTGTGAEPTDCDCECGDTGVNGGFVVADCGGCATGEVPCSRSGQFTGSGCLSGLSNANIDYEWKAIEATPGHGVWVGTVDFTICEGAVSAQMVIEIHYDCAGTGSPNGWSGSGAIYAIGSPPCVFDLTITGSTCESDDGYPGCYWTANVSADCLQGAGLTCCDADVVICGGFGGPCPVPDCCVNCTDAFVIDFTGAINNLCSTCSDFNTLYAITQYMAATDPSICLGPTRWRSATFTVCTTTYQFFMECSNSSNGAYIHLIDTSNVEPVWGTDTNDIATWFNNDFICGNGTWTQTKGSLTSDCDLTNCPITVA